MQELNRLVKSSREWMESNAPVMPPLLPVRNLLRGVSPKVNGTEVTATATYKGPVTETLVFMEYPFATAKPVDEEDKPAEPKPAAERQPAK